MKKTTRQPHNNLFEMVMSMPAEAEAFINHFSEELKGKIKEKSYQLKNRTHIDDELKPHIPDVIHQVEYEGFPAYLYLLFEHKSKFELVDVQLGRYLFIGYHEQKLAWTQENKIRKEQEKPSLGKFVPRLILPIVVYHGEEDWRDDKFKDLFKIPESLKKYIPPIEYILIDLSDYPDAFIEQVKSKFLSGVLLLLKHKGDKEFIKQHSNKILNFVEDSPESHETKTLLKTVINYIYQTFNLETEEVQQIITDLPTNAKNNMVSTWDRLIQEGQIKGEAIGEARGEAKGIQIGEAKGIQIGEAKGEQIGKQETELKKNLEITLNLLKEMPKWKNKKIAKITKTEKAFVKRVKKTFAKKQEKEIIEFLQEFFKDMPQMDNKRWEGIEKWGLALWKEYQAV